MTDRTAAAVDAIAAAFTNEEAGGMRLAICRARARGAIAGLPADVRAVLAGEMIAVRPETLALIGQGRDR